MFAKKKSTNAIIFPSQLKLILSVDRLDYSKGIPGRIKAYEPDPSYGRGVPTQRVSG